MDLTSPPPPPPHDHHYHYANIPLARPNEDETAIHGYHSSGDMVVRMRYVLAILRIWYVRFSAESDKESWLDLTSLGYYPGYYPASRGYIPLKCSLCSQRTWVRG